MDSDLKNSLWNLLHDLYFSKLYHTFSNTPPPAKNVVEDLWRDFLKAQLDNIPYRGADVRNEVKAWFFDAEWFEVYDLLEFVAYLDSTYGYFGVEEKANQILKREMSGYRFVSGVLGPITNEAELAEIASAIQDSHRTALTGVSEHIQAALVKLSDRKNPDYRNSIKESISAVESIAKVIAEDSSSTLGSALKVIETKLGLHPALKRGFSLATGHLAEHAKAARS